MTLPELHLTGEALAAYVDGELAPLPHDRATAHLIRCPDCLTAVQVQREAKSLLATGGAPALPTGLLDRLHAVPMTTDLGPSGPGSGGELVAAGESLLVGAATPPRRIRQRHRRHLHLGRRMSIGQLPARRLRRGLAGAMAGMVVGVVGAAGPSSGLTVGIGGAAGGAGTGSQIVPASATVGGDAGRGRSSLQRSHLPRQPVHTGDAARVATPQAVIAR